MVMESHAKLLKAILTTPEELVSSSTLQTQKSINCFDCFEYYKLGYAFQTDAVSHYFRSYKGDF